MAELPILVSGAPRSGTGYAAALLRSAGLACGHENVYGCTSPWGDWGEWEAESSWLAAAALPVPARVAHQVRHPLAVIRSLLGIAFFETPSPYRDLVLAQLPRVAAEPTSACKAARFWCDWTALVDRHAEERWRLEDAPGALHAWLGLPVSAPAPQSSGPPEFDPGCLPAHLLAELRERAGAYGYIEGGGTWEN